MYVLNSEEGCLRAACELRFHRPGKPWSQPFLATGSAFYFYFLPHYKACGILVLWPGWDLHPLLWKHGVLNHWTAREVSYSLCFFLSVLSSIIHPINSCRTLLTCQMPSWHVNECSCVPLYMGRWVWPQGGVGWASNSGCCVCVCACVCTQVCVHWDLQIYMSLNLSMTTAGCIPTCSQYLCIYMCTCFYVWQLLRKSLQICKCVPEQNCLSLYICVSTLVYLSKCTCVSVRP